MPEETETGKQIKGALSGVAEGLAALFGEKEEKPEPEEEERPMIKMKPIPNPRHPVAPNQPQASPYFKEGVEGQGFGQVVEGVGDILSGGMDMAFHPVTMAATAGYYGAKKRITGSFGGKVGRSRTRSSKEPPSNNGDDPFNLPPDDTPPPPPPRY